MKNINNLFINIQRAAEIAQLGDFTLNVYAQKDYINAHSDFQLLKEFLYPLFDNWGDSLITCEMYQPRAEDYVKRSRPAETIDEINIRIEKAYKIKKPKYNESPKVDVSDSLLSTAALRLNLSIEATISVKKMAEVIAQLDGASYVGVEHTAESIQYHAPIILGNVCQCVTTPTPYLIFGGIKIPQHEIDVDDVSRAIEYLQSLK